MTATAPYSDSQLETAMATDSDPETARATVQTRVPRLEQQKEPALDLASAKHSVLLLDPAMDRPSEPASALE